MKIEVLGKEACVQAELRSIVIELSHNLPARRKWKKGKLYFELSLSNIRHIAQVFPDAEWSDEEPLRRLDKVTKEGHKTAGEKKLDRLPPEALAFPFKLKPFDHQLRAFGLSRDRHNFALFMEMGCVDSETEYLSPYGWIKISEYKGGKVAQWHPETGEAEFVAPTSYVKKPCRKMIRLKTSRGCDQLLSPEHRVPIVKRNGDIKIISAAALHADLCEFKTRNFRLPSSFTMKGQEGISLSDEDLRLQIVVMADGSFPKHSPHTKRVVVRLKKQRKIERLKKLLSGKDSYIREQKNTGFTIFSFESPIRCKKYPENFWRASDHQLDIIAEECLHWDGSVTHGKRFCSNHESDVDFIQYVFQTRGEIVGKLFDKRGSWSVHIRSRKNPFTLAGKNNVSSWENSPDGFKYCFEVPSTFLLFRRNGCIFPSGNTGKTKVIIDTAAYLFNIGEIDTLMITAPNGVHRQWINEQVPEHMADFVPYNSISYQSNWTKKFCKAFEELMSGPPDELKIVSFHVDAFSTKKGIDTASKVLNSGKCLWVVDESVRIKNPSAQRTKNILRLAALAPYRRILSGAPITQGVEDLYSQLKFLDEDILGFSSFWSFKSFFCIERPIPGAPPNARKIVGYHNLTTLQEALEGHSFRVVKSECLDLPEKLYMIREVPLTKEQIKAYEELKHNLVTQLSSGEVIAAPMAATKLMKMQQVLCGFLIPEVDEPAVPIPNNRISTAMDIVRETNGKILLWARFHYDIDMLGAALKDEGIKFVEYHGRISSENRVESLRSFKQDPDVKVFLANPQAGGTGLNLAEASTAIYYSNDFNADTRWQSEDRIHRIGQNNHCTYIDLVSPNTIDQHILKSLRAKKNVADSVLDVQQILEVI